MKSLLLMELMEKILILCGCATDPGEQEMFMPVKKQSKKKKLRTLVVPSGCHLCVSSRGWLHSGGHRTGLVRAKGGKEAGPLATGSSGGPRGGLAPCNLQQPSIETPKISEIMIMPYIKSRRELSCQALL